ncbi:pancreatic lipase-related protein 2-like isoform X2 [Stegodyphus dumicola]|uniref:pancreatic lipase-related protein 2-like isoform X2 n=1 Tax=Stegodyphus dumicola TaxID=202533 RepID=UPI0015A883A7|nr:pancreatic lipase-related protein 2-like isoform X2 [Stegodyphus dumicola]
MKCFACVLPLLWLVVLAGEYEEYIEGYDLVHDIGGINQCHEGVWHLARLGDEVCIKGLGCFKLTKDYFHPQYRPCNVLPEPRSLIHTKFVLFTRNNIHQGKFLVADNETSIRESGFNANHSTRFIIHGYQENPLHDAWVLILMREFLNYNDTNVVIVDWSAGSQAPYIQAVANARVVGAEIARMVNALKKFGNLTTSMLHIIGNGLGAHVAGYAGQSILPMVSRITGLDPAYKYFCNMPMNVRLDPMDADFVDVIHTELKDYDAVVGDRLNAVALFTSTIRNRTCKMIGYYCRNYKAFQRGECGDCGGDGSRCAPFGFRADQYEPFKDSNFSAMYLVAGHYPRFCVYEYRIRMQLEHINSKPENHSRSGNLLLLLRGEKKPLFVHLRFYSMHDGKEYTFLVTSSVNIGDVREVSARWEEPGIYDEHFYSGQPVWNFRDSNVNIPMMNITLLNFDPSGENTGPTEISFCKSGEVNEQGWMTYVQNC